MKKEIRGFGTKEGAIKNLKNNEATYTHFNYKPRYKKMSAKKALVKFGK